MLNLGLYSLFQPTQLRLLKLTFGHHCRQFLVRCALFTPFFAFVFGLGHHRSVSVQFCFGRFLFAGNLRFQVFKQRVTLHFA